MEELKEFIETAIALISKHITEDEMWKDDPILGEFNRGRLAAEKYDIEVLKKVQAMASKL